MAPLCEKSMIESLIYKCAIFSLDMNGVTRLLKSILIDFIRIFEHVFQLGKFHPLDVLRHLINFIVLAVVILPNFSNNIAAVLFLSFLLLQQPVLRSNCTLGFRCH